MTSLNPAETLIRQLIATSPLRRVSFAEAMQAALYDPDHGYYGRGPRRIGRGGDFFTAVSVGPLYGRLLAQVAMETWESLGRPAEFTIIEQGAHDGQLAADIWQGLQGQMSAAAAVRYCIIEPQPCYRAVQQERLGPVMGERISWANDLSALHGNGMLLCNELLDAFPVHRVRWDGEAWTEMMLVADGDLTWQAAPIMNAAVLKEVARLPDDLPTGYITEVHPAAAQWAHELANTMFKGAVLIADYGYEQREYYSPERSDGTLRRYHEHRMDGEVLSNLGHCDLTAHINFTRVIEEAECGGFVVKRFMEQGRFLTHAVKPWLSSLEGLLPTADTMALLRQFQTLTHPSQMGMAFRMLLMSRGSSHQG